MTQKEQLHELLTRLNLNFRCEEDSDLVRLNVQMPQGGHYEVAILVEDELLQFFVGWGHRVPEGSRADVGAAIHCANLGLKIVKFEFDLRDGEIRYQIAMHYEGSLPSDAIFGRWLLAGITTVDRYLPAFLSVIYANEPAQDAIAMVEQ